MNRLNSNNLKLKSRIGKDAIETIINKIVIRKVSNILTVDDFNYESVSNFDDKFNKEFNEKFDNEFEDLTISKFVNRFNNNFIKDNKSIKNNKFNPSFNNTFLLEDDRTINSDCSVSDKKNDGVINNDCSFYDEELTELNNTKTMFNEFRTIYLSKSAIKQYLFYYFIPHNELYERRNVSYKDIATYCDFSIPTVKANHRLLESVGLISPISASFGSVSFTIVNEDALHKSKKDGGKGYVTISLDMLSSLLLINNVNELKVNLKSLKHVDAKNSSFGKKVRFNKENLISMLPDYIKKSKNKVNEILNSKSSLFKIHKGTLDTSNYETKKDIDDKYNRLFRDKIVDMFGLNNTAFSKNYANLVAKSVYLAENGYQFQVDEILRNLEGEKEFIITDICNLIMQYGFNKVKSAIELMFDDYCLFDEKLSITDNEINNPGAFIRVLIRNNINKFGSLYKIA